MSPHPRLRRDRREKRGAETPAPRHWAGWRKWPSLQTRTDGSRVLLTDGSEGAVSFRSSMHSRRALPVSCTIGSGPPVRIA